jgi:class 3 adenylate cyclase/tetratricopeptide (TPR) repeat protein
MNCPACGRDNRAEARFCSGCAAPLQPDCPSCGARNEPGARFCDQCATPLAGEPPAPRGPLRPESAPRAYTPKHLTDRILQSKSAIEGERKHVTVLFVDIAGYTSLSERLDPEQVHALMDRCFRHILEEVHRYEGTVNQFTGDGVMALFGAPIALEGAPRRAIMAALGMQRSLESLRQEMLAEGGPDVRMRVGIHSGPVVVGRIGDDLRMDYTAVGDTTNLADRLQRLAPPGSIYISEATEHLVSGFFDLVDLGPQRVKGKAEPVHAFEVVGERAVRGRIEATADAGLTPLVGRGRELDLLWSAFESARAGNGQVAFLVGEAGIGKSRLLSEFRRKLGDEPHTWIEGRCTSYGEHTAFYAIIDALRRRFGLEDKDGEATALAKVQEAQEAVGGDLDWTLPFVRSLLSLPAGDRAVAEMDAVTRRSETVRALHARILRAAERNPLIFVVEDLHWIDAASEEFLTFLADSIPAMRVLLVFAHRPGYQHPFGDRSYHTRISLQPLSASEMADMADSILETSTLPDEVRGLITSKAEGNPFFVEEVTKSLLEEGVLHLEQGRVEVAGPVEDVSVPDSITDVLMARIDRLPDEPKRAIQVASVIGREFALRLLERISEAGDRVSAVVEDLRALELILQKSAYPELAFMFKHALTCDVAYESVLLQRRKTLHRIVGAAIEELYRDRLVEHLDALAYHFTLGEEWERAFEYHDRASEKAADAFANHAAAEHCRQALAVAEHLAEAVPDAKRLRLEERLGKACWCVNRFAASGDAYLRAADLAAEPAVRATNLGRAANSLIWGHDYDRARTTTDEALTLARAIHSPAAEAVGLSCRYEQSMVEGETQAGHLVNEAAPLAERSGDAEAIVFALVQQAQYAEWHGTYGAAVSIAERACTLQRGDDTPRAPAPLDPRQGPLLPGRVRTRSLRTARGPRALRSRRRPRLQDPAPEYPRLVLLGARKPRARQPVQPRVCDPREQDGRARARSRCAGALRQCRGEPGWKPHRTRRSGWRHGAPGADPGGPRPTWRPVDALALLAARAGRPRPRGARARGPGARTSPDRRGAGGRSHTPGPEARSASPRAAWESAGGIGAPARGAGDARACTGGRPEAGVPAGGMASDLAARRAGPALRKPLRCGAARRPGTGPP